MNPFGAGAALHRPIPQGHIISAHSAEKDWARVRMNAAAHQDKENNEKTGKRKAGEERRQETNFKEAACCPSAVVQGQHDEKMVCVGRVPGVTGTLGKANSHFDPTQTRLGKAPPCLCGC